MKKRDIIIVTLCVVTAAVCIALTFCGNYKNNGVLTTDAFIGVLATLIGVCATIIVGLQIASFIELRDVKKQVEFAKQERAKIEELVEHVKLAKSALSNAFIAIANTSDDPLNSLPSKIMCIVCTDIEDVDYEVTMQRYVNLKEELLSEPENIRGAMEYFVDSLKQIEIPRTMNNYIEIAKIHYEVISIIDEAYKNTTQSN